MSYAGRSSYTIPASPTNRAYSFGHLNHALTLGSGSFDRRAIAGKTGWTGSAGSCLMTVAEQDGVRLIVIVLKADQGEVTGAAYADTKALLDYGFAGWSMMTVYPEVPLAPVDVLLGVQAQVQPQLERDCRLLVRRGEESAVTTQVELPADLEAPVEQGQRLGELTVYVNGELRDTIPIVSAQGAQRLTAPGIFSRLLRELFMAG